MSKYMKTNNIIKTKISLRKVINQHCKDCIYDPQAKGEGSWRQQVTMCTVSECALYPVRPRTTSIRDVSNDKI